MNEIKRYVNAVERGLCMDRRTKARVMSDFSSDLQSRLDAGKTFDQVRAELGEPRQAAQALNLEFAGSCRPQSSPLRWLFLLGALALAAAAAGAPEALRQWLASLFEVQPAATVGVIGGADGPTAIFVTTKTIGAWQTLPYLFGGVGGFLLFGWCRRGGKKRLWAPAVLCGGAVLWRVAGMAGLLYAAARASGTVLPLLPELIKTELLGGLWLCLLVLALTAAFRRAA